MAIKNMTTVFVLIALLAGSTFAAYLQEKEPRKVKRVKRPVFKQKDWDGIYFDDLFKDGLVGNRPSPADIVKKPQTADSTEEASTNSAAGTWSSLIGNDVIEDEVKALEQALQADITTPVKFKSEYLKMRQSFSMLSMLFAIIRDYDTDDIRWKKHSGAAQVAFARAAAASRVGTEQAYQNSRLRRDDLVELVRGGNFNSEEAVPDSLEWPSVVDRSPLMDRLQVAVDLLKPATSNKTEFMKNAEIVYHEASIVAAIGSVLLQEEMDEYDEDGYVDFAKAMTSAATGVVTGTKNQDYDLVSKSVNLIDQSCTNCHEEWR